MFLVLNKNPIIIIKKIFFFFIRDIKLLIDFIEIDYSAHPIFVTQTVRKEKREKIFFRILISVDKERFIYFSKNVYPKCLFFLINQLTFYYLLMLLVLYEDFFHVYYHAHVESHCNHIDFHQIHYMMHVF